MRLSLSPRHTLWSHHLGKGWMGPGNWSRSSCVWHHYRQAVRQSLPWHGQKKYRLQQYIKFLFIRLNNPITTKLSICKTVLFTLTKYFCFHLCIYLVLISYENKNVFPKRSYKVVNPILHMVYSINNWIKVTLQIPPTLKYNQLHVVLQRPLSSYATYV